MISSLSDMLQNTPFLQASRGKIGTACSLPTFYKENIATVFKLSNTPCIWRVLGLKNERRRRNCSFLFVNCCSLPISVLQPTVWWIRKCQFMYKGGSQYESVMLEAITRLEQAVKCRIASTIPASACVAPSHISDSLTSDTASRLKLFWIVYIK